MRRHLVPLLLGFAFLGTTRAAPPSEPKGKNDPDIASERSARLWGDLAGLDASKAYRAIWELTKTPRETAAYIAGRST